ncbi:MAG: hypothetical protein QOJ21_2306, partial [Solirubrobacteraceae bacterium]|nr:hypothetical protein [Solirubrobacteraceae bacterium]
MGIRTNARAGKPTEPFGTGGFSRALLLALVATVCSAAIAAPAQGANVWRQTVTTAALDPASASYVTELRRQVTKYGPWVNTWQYSSPLYSVSSSQPTVRVTLDVNNAALQSAFNAVPLPPDARPADGTDESLVVSQPSTNTLWEFWRLHKVSGVWHARWGGKMTNVSSNPGYFTSPHPDWGGTATSLSLSDGMIRVSEFQNKRIDHAVALAIPQARMNYFSLPAQRTDGSYNSTAAIPEGARFRLDPTLNLNTLNLPPFVRTIADAAQRYGIILRDQAGAVTFYAEQPVSAKTDPYPAIFGHKDVMSQMKLFPWARLQTLKTDMRCCG